MYFSIKESDTEPIVQDAMHLYYITHTHTHTALTYAPSCTSLEQQLGSLSDVHWQFVAVHELRVNTSCKNLQNVEVLESKQEALTCTRGCNRCVANYLLDKCQRLHAASVRVAPADFYQFFERLSHALDR